MGLTLSAVSLVVLLMPGLLFYLGYAAGPDQFSRATVQRQGVDAETRAHAPAFGINFSLDQDRILVVLLLGVVLSIPLHEAWVSIAVTPTPLVVEYRTVLFLIGGVLADDIGLQEILRSVVAFAPAITAYFLSLYVISYLAGWSARWLLTQTSLDRYIKFLDRRDDWYYLFSGLRLNSEPCDLTVVSVVLEQGSVPYVYRGVLHGYTAQNNELRTITLTETARFALAGGDDGAEPVWMSGEFFLVDCTQVKSMDVDYFYFSDEELERDSLVETD